MREAPGSRQVVRELQGQEWGGSGEAVLSMGNSCLVRFHRECKAGRL